MASSPREGVVLCFPEGLQPLDFICSCEKGEFGAKMDNRFIDKILFENPATRKFFMGTFPSDGLPGCSRFPCSLIVNLDRAGRPGSHWTIRGPYSQCLMATWLVLLAPRSVSGGSDPSGCK
uniref:Uncharacterized protein n=1 Tax=Globodera rostochiensis TaxID=31243 RepID=A0A914HSF0_GLORO